MNYYFLLEDEKSFLKVLPLWLEYMNFGIKRVPDIQEVQENNYVLQSGRMVEVGHAVQNRDGACLCKVNNGFVVDNPCHDHVNQL